MEVWEHAGSEVIKLKSLEDENTKLKRSGAELSLENMA